jgi:hypothetical protein
MDTDPEISNAQKVDKLEKEIGKVVSPEMEQPCFVATAQTDHA